MATGIYHKHNVLKMRIMHTVFFAGKPLTCKEIADNLGLPLVNISTMMRHYHKQKEHKYFRKLKPIKGKAYRYKLTKSGAIYLAKYCWRFHEGFSLSLYKTKKMPKRDKIMAERKAEAAQRQVELDKTGVEIPQKPKPTLKELLNFDPAELVDYMGITKQGALEMGITEILLDF
jgi:hypothetical protein